MQNFGRIVVVLGLVAGCKGAPDGSVGASGGASSSASTGDRATGTGGSSISSASSGAGASTSGAGASTSTGPTTSTSSGGPTMCVIGGSTYASDTANPLNPCQSCQPSVNATAWSPVADGTSCPDGGSCALGGCLVALTQISSQASNIYDFAVGPSAVYWTFEGYIENGQELAGTVQSAPLDGGTPTTIYSELAHPTNIVANATGVYWTNNDCYSTYLTCALECLSAGGVFGFGFASQSLLTVSSGDINATGIGVDDENAYWGVSFFPSCGNGPTETKVGSLSGGGDGTFIAGLECPSPLIDAANVYCGPFKYPKNGGPPVTLTWAAGYYGFAVDTASIYLSDGQHLAKASVCGGSQMLLYTGPTKDINSPITDGERFYWLNAAGDILSVPVTGGTATLLAKSMGIFSNTKLIVDATSLYFVNGLIPGSGITKLTPKGDLSVTPAPTCSIGGSTYAAGAQNPTDACQSCDPTKSPTAWVTAADNATVGCCGGVCCGGACCNGACCNGVCADLQTDNANCGACGLACAPGCTKGECIVTIATGEEPSAVAVDATNVYFTDVIAKTVVQASIAGGSPITLASNLAGVNGLAIDAANVYFSTQGTYANLYADGAIWRVPIGGGSAPVSIAGPQTEPTGLVLDASNLYWTTNLGVTSGSGGTVTKVAKSGGAATVLTTEPYSIGRVAVGPASVYFVGYVANMVDTISAVPIAGGSPVTLVTLTNPPTAITVDATSVLWAGSDTSTTYTTPTLNSMPLAGGSATLLASFSMGGAYALVTDGVSAYTVTNEPPIFIYKIPVVGGTPAQVYPGPNPNQINGIAIDAKSVYVTTASDTTGAVLQITPR